MKSLFIPFLPELQSISASDAAEMVDEFGTRFPVEELNWPETFSYRPLTTVCAASSETALYLLYQVHGNCLRAVCTKDNERVNEDSCVEFFVKKPDSDWYYNFEFNCAGVCKAAKHFRTRDQGEDLPLDQLATIDRWSSIGKRAFNALNGLFSWELCICIPFELFGVEPGTRPLRLLGNFYKCADATDQPHYVTWNPVPTSKPDFHRPEHFGEIVIL